MPDINQLIGRCYNICIDTADCVSVTPLRPWADELDRAVCSVLVTALQDALDSGHVGGITFDRDDGPRREHQP